LRRGTVANGELHYLRSRTEVDDVCIMAGRHRHETLLNACIKEGHQFE
jgi:hypothetical protein